MNNDGIFWCKRFGLAYITLGIFILALQYTQSKLVYSLIWSFGIYGVIRYVFTNIVMKIVWDKILPSYDQSKKIASKLRRIKDLEKNISAPLHPKIREPFKWAPSTIGIIEGVIYTVSIIFNKLGLIGFWLAFKALGEWNDSDNLKKKQPTRIRANNFVIGNGVSLITGIIGGIIFWYFYNPSVLQKTIDTAYQIAK